MNNSLGRIKSNFTKYSELFYTSRKHTVSFHTKTRESFGLILSFSMLISFIGTIPT